LIVLSLAMALVCAFGGFAQNQKSEEAKDWVDQWKIATDQLIGVAEAMPAEKYDYKPVKEVGAFGDQLKHAGIAMCILLANAEGKKVEIKDVMLDRLKTKEEIITELRKISGEGPAVINRGGGNSDEAELESHFFCKTTR